MPWQKSPRNVSSFVVPTARPENQQQSDESSFGIRGDQLRAPLNPSDRHSTSVWKGLMGALHFPILCRETLVSWTADEIFSSLGSAHSHSNKSACQFPSIFIDIK